MRQFRKSVIALILAAAFTLGGCASGKETAADGTGGESSLSSVVSESLDESFTNTTVSESVDSSADGESAAEEERGDTNTSNSDSENTSAENDGVVSTDSGTAGGSSDAFSSGADASESGSAATSASGVGTSVSSQKTPAAESFSVEWKLSSTWQNGTVYCGGYEVVITNNTDRDIDGWTAVTSVPDGFELLSKWNGIFKVENTTLTVSNESYNSALGKGACVSFGFNYSSLTEFSPSGVKVNGSSASGGSVAGTTTAATSVSENTAIKTTTTRAESTAAPAPSDPDGATPVSRHGTLSVKGAQLVDENGKAYQLTGMSTHGIGWFPDFVNEQAFRTLRDDWNTNVIRLAMYTGAGEGYTGSAMAQHEALVKKGIEIAIKLDMYVIVDWHVLADQSPQVRKDDALRFFNEISELYGDYPNIIYEICNEPNGYATWSGDIKPYAEEVIPVIRKNDPDSVIIVGTPTWSQDIDKALNNPLDYDNVMYALHFYAATHTDWLRQRVQKCAGAGLPIFVSEFGCCDASGNGANDFTQTKAWLNLLDELGISYINWNLANKNESSSAFIASASPYGNWSTSDMSEGGAWIRRWFRGEIG